MKAVVRYIPQDILKTIVTTTKGIADPQGSNALMHYSTIVKNNVTYNTEVLYDKVSNTIMHFKYTQKAIGPLPKIK